MKKPNGLDSLSLKKNLLCTAVIMPLAKSIVFAIPVFFLAARARVELLFTFGQANVDVDLAMAVKHVYAYQGVAAVC